MSSSEINSLIDTVEREAEMHPVDIEAVRHIEGDDSDGITIRVLETDATAESDQVGFQVTKPNTDMGRQIFTERLGSGFRSLSDHLRSDDDSDDDPDDDTLKETSSDQTESTESSSTENSRREEPMDDGSATDEIIETREVGTFSITTSLNEDSLDRLSTELDTTFEEITDELPDEERIENIENDVDDLDERLSTLEQKLAMLGSFDGGG